MITLQQPLQCASSEVAMGAVACPAENGPQQPLETNEALKAQLSALGSVLSAGQRDTARALHLLDSLIQTVSSSRKEEICTGILAEACLTCSRAVHPVEWGPTVSLKALNSLATLLHLCKQSEGHSDAASQFPAGLDAIALAQSVARALQADTELTTVAAGLAALHALAACMCTGTPQDRLAAGGLLDAVGDAGVVEAAASALQRLALLPGQLPEQQAQQAQQQHAVQGLEVLHCVCYGHEANLQRLVAAGGLPSVASATALTVHPAGLALVAQLASRQAAQHAERQLAARALLAAAQRAQQAPQLQSAALQGLYCLLAGGTAGAACGTQVLPAEDVVGGLLPLLQGGREAAEPGALAAQVYGLAAVGTVASALSEPLPGPVLEMLQTAVARMAALLGQAPAGAVSFGAAALSAPSGDATQQTQHAEQQHAQQAGMGEWEALRAAVEGLVVLLGASGPEGVNTSDRDGFTLLHRLAAAGIPQALELLLSIPCSPALDLLVRTRDGANALQLASKSGHAACVTTLEGPTQAAAQRVMNALLAELDQEAGGGKERSAGGGGGAAAGGKKKKTVEKSSNYSRPGSGQGTSSADEVGAVPEEAVASDADDVEASVQLTNGLTEEQRRRRRELEDAYERALEARRQELEQQAAQRAQQAEQQQAQHAQRGSAAATPPSSQAGSPSSRPAGGVGGDFQPPASPQPQEGGPMLSAFASTGSSGPLDYPAVSFNTTPPAPSPLISAFAAKAAAGCAGGSGGGVAGLGGSQSFANSPGTADRQTAFSIAGVDLSHTLASSRSLLGAGGSSGTAAPVQMAPALSGDLHGQLSLGAQQYQQAPVLVGSPTQSTQASAFAAAGGAYPSPLQHQGSLTLGAHQLSGNLEQASAFAQLATAGSGLAAATPFAQHAQRGTVLPYPGDAAMHAGAAARQAARSFSSHLQDAMFYAGGDGPGSPQTSSAAAVAARNALAAAAVNNLAARAASLPLQLSGRAGSAADEILNLLPMVGSAAANPAAAAAALEGLARQHSQAWAQGLADGLGDDRNKSSDPDVSGEPTRHLWIGNLGTRTPRAVLKTIFEKYGVVDDVVTFPGRMYAFVNYRSLDEALAAYETMQGQVVPELTGDRPLLLKFRPAKKAAAHLRALGLAADDGSALPGGAEGACAAGAAAPGGAGGALGAAGSDAERLFGAGGSGGAAGAGLGAGGDVDKDGNSLEPSPRIWLGNIAPTATSKSLNAVLSRFGALTDAAVFPARIGPLGYAFVKFERLEDAVRAFETLNNTVVPPLSGSKQLKMRYKPPSDGPPGKDDLTDGSKVMVPSRHLWLGNVTQKPTDEQVLEVFQTFGKVDSVRVFPVKAYAFVNYAEIASAIKAMSSLEGVAIPALTGVKPLVMRYQQEAVVAAAAAAAATAAPKPLGLPPPCPLSRAASDVGLTFGGAGAQQLLSAANSLAANSLLPPLLGTPEDALLHQAAADDAAAAAAVASLQSVPNLSNRLNPNNVHFDPELAERYKALSRREKDMLWATDQLMAAHQLAAQQQAVAAAAAVSGTAGGSMPPPEMLNLLNRGMNRSHSWNISMLHNHMQQHPNQPASGLSPALAAAAALAAAQHQQQQHAAAVHQSHMATLRLLNNPPGEGPAFPPMSQPQHAAHDMAGLLHQQVQHAQHAQAAQQGLGVAAQPAPSPTATASPAQLSAVLSNLAALQSMHAASGGPVAAAAGAGLAASMQRAASMPVAGGHVLPVSRFGALESSALVSPYLNGGQPEHAQHDVLAGLMQMPAAGSPTHDGGNGMEGSAAVSPDAQLDMSRQLSSMLAKQSLGACASPVHSPVPGHSLGMVMAASPGGHSRAQQGTAGPIASSLPMSPPGMALGAAGAAPGSPLQMQQQGHSAFAAAAGGGGAGAIPDQLLCPLSGQVMLEPVVAADGVTYERRAISDWLAVRDTSPVTQSPLPHKMLTPSLATKAALMDYLQRGHLGM